MDLPEVERLITNAVNNRPTVTNAPVNLYVYKGKVICGARAVMPGDAVFVSHAASDKLERGFDSGEWKLIVEKTRQAINDSPAADDNAGQRRTNFADRRREQRLSLRRSIWFGQERKQTLSPGQMVDIASGGMAFTCCAKEAPSLQGQTITTRFSVPCFGPDDSVRMHRFTRSGRICRVSDVSGFLKRIAIQFAEPLPFKPAEQNHSEIAVQQFTEPAFS